VSSENVDLLMGTFFSHIGLAVADFAKQKQVFFLAAEPLTDAIVWSQGNDYTFRLRPSTSMQAKMLAEEAAKLPAIRWATIAPNYEYGTSAVAAFKEALEALKPDVEWVDEQWPPLGKLDAGATVQALARAEPEAIFNVTFGPDLTKFVREGQTRGLFEDREVVSLLTGEPEYLDPLGADTPEGWIVTGYPWYGIDTPEHDKFLAAYQEMFNDYPRLGSIVGYSAMMSVGEILKAAASTETEDLIAAAKGIEVPTPLGTITYRPADHQSTMGAYVGKTAVEDGKGVMVDYEYRDGADYLPSEDEVKALRTQ
jgi:branched-chain amino acid transport system substrate-binding protein